MAEILDNNLSLELNEVRFDESRLLSFYALGNMH